jgi:hypothetical protein
VRLARRPAREPDHVKLLSFAQPAGLPPASFILEPMAVHFDLSFQFPAAEAQRFGRNSFSASFWLHDES